MPETIINWIPKRPLVCIPGESRPEGVTFIEKECTVETARSHYRLSTYVDSFFSMIGLVIKGKDPSLPVTVKELGIMDVRHPLMDIAYSLDYFGLEDFRSAEVFDQAAESPEMLDVIGTKRDLVLLYPASGSHISPLLIPMKLIDSEKIDSAEVVLTEIDKSVPFRIGLYLDFYSSNGLIQNYSKRVKKHGKGSEHIYSFEYRSKKIKIILKLNMGGDVYALDKDIKKADVIIFHDSVENIHANDDKNDDIADLFIARLHKIGSGKKRLLITDKMWECRNNGAVVDCDINGSRVSGRSVNGAYGCSRNKYFFNLHATGLPDIGMSSGGFYPKRTYSIGSGIEESLTTFKVNTVEQKLCHRKEEGCQDILSSRVEVHKPTTDPLRTGAILFLFDL